MSIKQDVQKQCCVTADSLSSNQLQSRLLKVLRRVRLSIVNAISEFFWQYLTLTLALWQQPEDLDLFPETLVIKLRFGRRGSINKLI